MKEQEDIGETFLRENSTFSKYFDYCELRLMQKSIYKYNDNVYRIVRNFHLSRTYSFPACICYIDNF